MCLWLVIGTLVACSASSKDDVPGAAAPSAKASVVPAAPASPPAPGVKAGAPVLSVEQTDTIWRAIQAGALVRDPSGQRPAGSLQELASRVLSDLPKSGTSFAPLELRIYAQGERVSTANQPDAKLRVDFWATGCDAYERFLASKEGIPSEISRVGIGFRKNTDRELTAEEHEDFSQLIAHSRRGCCVQGICGTHGFCGQEACICEAGWEGATCSSSREWNDGEQHDVVVEILPATKDGCTTAIISSIKSREGGTPALSVGDTVLLDRALTKAKLSWRVRLGGGAEKCDLHVVSAQPLGDVWSARFSEDSLDDAPRYQARKKRRH